MEIPEGDHRAEQVKGVVFLAFAARSAVSSLLLKKKISSKTNPHTLVRRQREQLEEVAKRERRESLEYCHKIRFFARAESATKRPPPCWQ